MLTTELNKTLYIIVFNYTIKIEIKEKLHKHTDEHIYVAYKNIEL